MNPSKIEQCVEILSQKGCDEVWKTIDALERSQSIAEASNLTQDERLAVLAELKAIMAVYQEKK